MFLLNNNKMCLFHNKKLYIFAKFFIDKSFIGALIRKILW